jgi:hypothetical protein
MTREKKEFRLRTLQKNVTVEEPQEEPGRTQQRIGEEMGIPLKKNVEEMG